VQAGDFIKGDMITRLRQSALNAAAIVSANKRRRTEFGRKAPKRSRPFNFQSHKNAIPLLLAVTLLPKHIATVFIPRL